MIFCISRSPLNCATFATLILLALGIEVFAQTSVTLQVSSGSDNADQSTSGGTVWVDDNYALMANYTGFRFQNVNIPAGATIQSATLELTSYGTGTTSFSVNVYAEDQDNPTAFSSSFYNVSNRTRTSAYTAWNTGTTSFVNGVSFSSPDIASVIQEVISRPGWASGNSLVILTTPNSGNKGIWKHRGNASYAAKLNITYSTAATEPIVHYTFDETSGNIINQGTLGSSADADEFRGTVIRAASPIPENGGTAIRFADGSISPGQVNGLNRGPGYPITQRTYDFWFVADHTNGRQVLFEEGGATRQIIAYLDEGTLYFTAFNRADSIRWGTPTPFYISTSEPIIPGTRYHVAVVLDSQLGSATGEFRGYLNGKLVGTVTDVGPMWAHNPLEIGRAERSIRYHDNSVHNGTHGPFYGTIDEFKIWDVVLSEQTIQDIYEENWGLAGHWRLDETSGTIANDSSGSINHGFYFNGPDQGIDAIRRTGAEFERDAGYDRVHLDANAIHGADEVSVAWWMKTEETGSQSILSGASSGHNNSFLIFFQNHTNLSVYYGNPRTDFTIDSVATGTWRHFVITHVPTTGEVNLYIDGKYDQTNYLSRTDVSYDIDTDGLVLAEEQDSVNGGYVTSQAFAGTLDDVRIYRRIISGSEIAEIHGLVGQWKLDETTSSIAEDSTGWNHDGTYLGGYTQNVAGPDSDNHPIATAFDGINGKVDLPAVNHDFSEGFAASMWVRPSSIPADSTLNSFLSLSSSGGANEAWFGWRKGFGLEFFHEGPNGTESIDDGSDLSISGWIHVAVSIDEDGFVTLYRNAASTTGVQTMELPLSVNRSDNFIASSALNDLFHGRMYDVRLYNRPLSEEELAEQVGIPSSDGIRIQSWQEIQ